MRQTDKRAALAASIRSLQIEAPASDAAAAGMARGIVGHALELHRQGLLDRLGALEAEQAAGSSRGDVLVRLDPGLIDAPLPADRDARAFADEAFAMLKSSIRERGQDTPIIVRRAGERYELACGRRRVAACRELKIAVLARILPLDDEAMLALQYRENAERADVSALERGRWFARLAEHEGYSTTRLAHLTGLSQPSIVDYLKLGRLPDSLIDRLADPRSLSLADGRRLHAALHADPQAPARMLEGLAVTAGRSLREQVAAALAAAKRSAHASAAAIPPMAGRIVLDHQGRKLVTISRSGNQWIYRWAPGIDDAAIAWIAERLHELLGEWSARAGGIYQCTDKHASKEGTETGSPST